MDTDNFYLRCAAYFRPLPRTRTQNQRAQTHSRGRAMLTPITKIALPSYVWSFSALFHLHNGNSNNITILMFPNKTNTKYPN